MQPFTDQSHKVYIKISIKDNIKRKINCKAKDYPTIDPTLPSHLFFLIYFCFLIYFSFFLFFISSYNIICLSCFSFFQLYNWILFYSHPNTYTQKNTESQKRTIKKVTHQPTECNKVCL